MFTPDALRTHLPETLAPLTIETYATISSTNKVAATKLATDPAPLWLLADQQTKGVGRRGKAFFSPAQTGLYMTYGGFDVALARLSLVTPAAGVALQQAAHSVLGVDTTIKWVNDVLLGTKKVAGILAERLSNGAVLVGVGINVAPSATAPDVPIDLPVGTLLPQAPAADVRPALAAAWLTRFAALLAQPNTIMPAYREHAAWLQQTVQVTGLCQPLVGTVAGFADDGALRLATDDGVQTLSSGSIRLLK